MLEPKDAFKYLPLVYDVAGLSSYAERYTPELIEFMWKNDWIGRRVLEIGCGTGASLEHFAEQKMVVDAVDASAAMLQCAQERFVNSEGDTTIQFIHSDVRKFKPRPGVYDLVFCLDTINYLSNPRDVEGLMRRANYALAMNKMFLFDLHTISGLVGEIQKHPTHVIHDSETDFLLSRSTFDFDHLSLTTSYTIFTIDNNGARHRFDERHVQRGYPFKVIETMLARSGFDLRVVVDARLEDFEEVDDRDRILFLAQKQREFTE